MMFSRLIHHCLAPLTTTTTTITTTTTTRLLATKMLPPSTAPLVFIDCEMSGLSASSLLLQIACIITTPTLTPLHPGISLTISRPPSVLAAMDAWCTRTHAATGLTAAVLASSLTVDAAAEQLLGYIKQHVPEKDVGVLAGNSVHVDKIFLDREMPAVTEWLHYRILDVSAIKEAARRWCGENVLRGVPEKRLEHEALADVRESIEEARYWMEVVFRPAKGQAEEGKGSVGEGKEEEVVERGRVERGL